VETNALHYDGDNLDVMQRHIADESVDLVYLDPQSQYGDDEHRGSEHESCLRDIESIHY